MSKRIKNVIVAGGLRYHLIPKVASSTLTRAIKIQPQRAAFPEEVGEQHRFMVVRHPLDRLVSMWTFFCFDPDRLQSNGIGEIGYEREMPFDKFLELVYDKYDLNQHTQKQVTFKGPHYVHDIVKLENLNSFWPTLQKKFDGLRDLGHFHKTDHKPWQEYYSPEQKKEAEFVFKEDLKLYKGAK